MLPQYLEFTEDLRRIMSVCLCLCLYGYELIAYYVGSVTCGELCVKTIHSLEIPNEPTL